MLWSVSSLFAQAQAATTPGATAYGPYLNLLATLGVIVLSFYLGGYLSRQLRMPDHGWKIGLCFFAILASSVTLLMGPPLKYGIDLRGGALLVYQVDEAQQKGEPVDMDKLVTAIAKRVNPGGQKEVTVRSYGQNAVEIIIPEKEEEVARIERIITQTGELQFRILADINDPQTDTKSIIDRAMADPSKTKLTDRQGKLLAWWVPVKPDEEKSFSGPGYNGIARRTRKQGNRDITEILVLNDRYNVTGQDLTSSRPAQDRQGRPCVNFNFTSSGGKRFGLLTHNHLPVELTNFTYKLGVVLDNELYSAPSIQSTITDSGEITGNFTDQEVQDLVNVLDAGRLPAALMKEPVSKLFSGPTLGQDTIESATRAMLLSAGLVVLFMLYYYRFSGIVANIALVMNMLILFAIMLAFKAAFTLTGFAGLALTVGMAVDNNILVFERLREERDRGATVRMAIRNAFHRAGATIIDCNTTHLIAATVLYWLGSDQIRGFAITLWIGVVTSMFTSVFVAHVIYDVAEKRQWLTKVKMARWIGHTNIDFMGMAPYCIAGSLLISVMAIAVSFHRGEGLFDIDFTGGVSVQVLFDQPQETSTVRKLLSEVPKADQLPDLAISDVQMAGEKAGLRFSINTSGDMKDVKRVLNKVFGNKLAHNALQFTEPTLIAAVKPTAKKSPTTPPAKAEPAPKKDQPASKQQSRAELSADRMLAFAGSDALALALTDEPAKSTPSAPKAAAPTKREATKETAPAAKLPAGQDAKTARPESSPLQPSEPASTATQNSVVTMPESFVGGCESRLNFRKELSHQAAGQFITAGLEALKIDPKSVAFSLSNPKYVEGQSDQYDRWDLKIMLSPEKTKAVLAQLAQQMPTEPIFPASSTIGAVVAGKTRELAVYALVASWIGIILYLWVRFQAVAFGFAAVVALVHDILVMLGAVAVSIYIAPYLGFLLVEPVKVNLSIVAAFLTIIGYSVNDTIVVFDRIREVRGKDPNLTREMVNASTNQTLSRTLLTSLTVFIVVIVLYCGAGTALHGFAFALLIGVITGTYSSIYIAAPILLWLVGKHRVENK
ncbi:MAG: protein translocase subunit SecD [Thermoguttaceae bacterium]